MKISYRFVAEFPVLKRAGFEIPDDSIYFIVQGDDIRLEKVKQLLGEEWQDCCLASTQFTEKELHSASYLRIFAKHYLGYAQPDTQKEVDFFEYPFDIYPYYKGVFEIANTDEEYGLLRGRQIGSYQIKGLPKWGKNKIGSLHYAEDAFFVPTEVYQEIFEPLKISYKAVLDYKTKKELFNIVQLLPQGISKSPLNLSKNYLKSEEKIEKWNLTKYLLRGDMPHPDFLEETNTFDFFYTQEYFGSGGLTQRNTIISKKLYQILKKNAIKGLIFRPLLKHKDKWVSHDRIGN